MRHFISLIAVLIFVSGCASVNNQRVPTSQRLEEVRLSHTVPLQEELRRQRLELGAPVFLRVFKREGRLEAWIRDEESLRFMPFKSYPICKYSGRLGPKLLEGDGQAPEGFYTVGAKQLNPNSQYHLSFDLGFPNEFDEAHGRTGSLLMIHGGCKSIGCYAMTDEAMEEIYLLVENSIKNGANVPVHIFPFRMNEMNIYANFDPMWITFWRNLEEGYRAFEETQIPPMVDHQYVREGGQGRYKYVFESPSIIAEHINHRIDVDKLKELVDLE